MDLIHPEVTDQALQILRRWDLLQGFIIPLIMLVLYVHWNEISKKNWNGMAAAMSLYMLHWLVEIVNALIQHFTGHALWTVPGNTTFLIMIGVGIEISLMFSIAGLVASKQLLDDPKAKILGINNRLFVALANAALFSILEIPLEKSPHFAWVYPWWGAVPVFITVYIPFFCAATYSYDWPRARQKKFIGTLFVINVAMLVLFGGVFGWI